MWGKTERTLEMNILAEMEELLGGGFSYSIGTHKGYLFDRKIQFFGANDSKAEEKIRGLTVAGAYGDELTLTPNSFFKMMLSRLSVKGAKLFGTTNPDAPKHWLNEEFLQREGELDLARFRFKLEDNPSLDPFYVQQLNLEYVGLWHKRFIGGLWVLAEGAVYDFWEDREPYLIRKENFPQASYHVVGIDYGTQNPFVAGLYGVNRNTRPKIWKEAELFYCGRDKGVQKTDGEYADMLQDWLKAKLPDGRRVRKIYPDPSARSFIVEMKKRGLPAVDNLDNSVLDGIRNQARLLKRGDYAVGMECEETRAEYASYIWDPKAQARGEDAPQKENDHTKDEERYVLMEEFGKETLNWGALITP